jgi:hypothetical protein
MNRNYFHWWCAASLLVAGCGGSAELQPPAANKSAEAGHAHGAGPHGGVIADWGGGEYHIEFGVDHGQQQATVHILGGDARTLAPIGADKLLLSLDQPAIELELTAQPLAEDPPGASSRFVGTHAALAEEREFSGSVTGEIDGVPYAGEFDEAAGD